MTFLWTLLIGLIVGVIAKAVTPGKDPGGCLVTIILGIVGASVAGYLGRAAGWYTEGQPVGFLASVLGAVLVLLIYRMITGRRS
ncbi:GlsB/YeaQ/YmgE family stress response membrane protein [Prosthecobacter sp.]|uniref:GlsB/YeaQ/YmgE family stress response membrane protein n=1 Tax=Prosthecobacter sp. TaxID=1965333 RepID=UPI0037853197